METNSNNEEYGFWFWSNKLEPIIRMISEIINCELFDGEIEVIKEELRNTNDEKEIWYSHLLTGKKIKLNIALAYDGEEGKDMIHIKILSEGNLRVKLETLNLFQSMFNKLELEK